MNTFKLNGYVATLDAHSGRWFVTRRGNLQIICRDAASARRWIEAR